MLQKKYKSVIVSITNPSVGIYTLELESLNGKYKYQPGQFLHLAIDEEYDGYGQWPESRCFSIQSNPNQNTLKLTYSVKGSFTRLMSEKLHQNSEVWLKLPYGNLFNQTHNKSNTVFIAGGTGITPFLSLFTHETFTEYINPRIYLGFRTASLNIYESELASARNSSLYLKIYIEETEGVIDINEIMRDCKIESNYFISGPPVMIKSFKSQLTAKGIPASNILIDEWE